jgi:hypothetical protein
MEIILFHCEVALWLYLKIVVKGGDYENFLKKSYLDFSPRYTPLMGYALTEDVSCIL